jgi:hypothetical protein
MRRGVQLVLQTALRCVRRRGRTWAEAGDEEVSLSSTGRGDLSDEEQDIEDEALHHWVFVDARFSVLP